MQSDTDGIRKECAAKKREWAKTDRAGLHALETALANTAIELTRRVPFRLKPRSRGPQSEQPKKVLRSQTKPCRQRRRSRIQNPVQPCIVVGRHQQGAA